MLVLTCGLDQLSQEVSGEGADVEEDAGCLGSAEAEMDLLLGQVWSQVRLLVCRKLCPAACLSGSNRWGLEVIVQPHALFKKGTNICREARTNLKNDETGLSPMPAMLGIWVNCRY